MGMITQSHRLLAETMVCDCCRKPLKSESRLFFYYGNPGSNNFAGERLKDTVWCEDCHSFNRHLMDKQKKEKKEEAINRIGSLKERIAKCEDREEFKRLTDELNDTQRLYGDLEITRPTIKQFGGVYAEERSYAVGVSYPISAYCLERLQDDPIIHRIHAGDIRTEEEFNLALGELRDCAPVNPPKNYFSSLISHFSDNVSLSTIGFRLLFSVSVSEKDKKELGWRIMEKLKPQQVGEGQNVIVHYMWQYASNKEEMYRLLPHTSSDSYQQYLNLMVSKGIISLAQKNAIMKQHDKSYGSNGHGSGCLGLVALLIMLPISFIVLRILVPVLL